MKNLLDILSPMDTPFRKGRRANAKVDPMSIPLDAVGQRSEDLRQRLDAYSGRLEDALLLREEFRQLVKPLSEIASELEAARTRIVELEQSLRVERRGREESSQALADLKSRFSAYELNLAELSRKYENASAELGERILQAGGLEEALRLSEEARTDIARKAAEFEKALKIHERESTVHRAALEASSARISRLEQDLNVATEQTTVLDRESLRLKEANVAYAHQVAELTALQKTLELDLSTARRRLAELESQYVQDKASADQAAVQQRTLLAAVQMEKTAAEELNASLKARLEIAEQTTRQLRQQQMEKDEASRTVERLYGELQISKSLIDNAHHALQADVAKLTDRVNEAEKARREAESRAAMMSKAIAAKDAILDQNAERITALTGMLADGESATQAEKAELVATNRRLVAELENERSERALLQGALNISRESRAEVQRQFDAFRRSARAPLVSIEAGSLASTESNVLSINQKN